MSSIYPSKLILLGEYTVLNGGGVLALPLDAFSASWSPVDAKEGSKESKSSILSIISSAYGSQSTSSIKLFSLASSYNAKEYLLAVVAEKLLFLLNFNSLI